MQKLQKLFFITICSLLTSVVNANPNIDSLQIDSYNQCLAQAQKLHTDINNINDSIIKCMEQKGFSVKGKESQLTKEEKAKIEQAIIQHRVNVTIECSNKFKTEEEIINCVSTTE